MATTRQGLEPPPFKNQTVPRVDLSVARGSNFIFRLLRAALAARHRRTDGWRLVICICMRPGSSEPPM